MISFLRNFGIIKSTQPFIFIAAMPRSGSTLLCGILTRKPEIIILSEPAFQRGEYRELDQYSVIPGFCPQKVKSFEGNPAKMLMGFKDKLLPQISKFYERAGVKECFLDNWKEYLKIFSKIKFIVLVRDPRDILLSTLDFGDHVSWHRQMWADQATDSIAERYYRTWQFQKEIMASQDYLAVRYEDLCLSEASLNRVTDYCGLSPSAFKEAVSAVTGSYPYRLWEIEKHNGRLGSESVFRYRREKNVARLKRAHEFAEKFRDYSRHWGYEESCDS